MLKEQISIRLYKVGLAVQNWDRLELVLSSVVSLHFHGLAFRLYPS